MGEITNDNPQSLVLFTYGVLPHIYKTTDKHINSRDFFPWSLLKSRCMHPEAPSSGMYLPVVSHVTKVFVFKMFTDGV